ncbi:MAG: alpha/beta hydrolase [Dongiaceae bacterium]
MRWLGFAFWIAAAVFFLWALAVAALWALQDRIVFQFDDRPLGDPPSTIGGLVAATLATADGLDLHFWLAPPDPGRAVIVYFHGNGGNAGDRADALAPLIAAGQGVVLAEYRGYGGNPGKPSEVAFLADGAAYLDAVRSRFPGHRIVLWGESLGGGIALPLALDDGVAGVILDSPFTSVPALAAEKYPWVPVDALLRTRFDNLARIGELRVPLLILHGERDPIVPVSHGRRLLAAAGEPKTGIFLPGIGHLAFLVDDSGAARMAVEGFLAVVERPE